MQPILEAKSVLPLYSLNRGFAQCSTHLHMHDFTTVNDLIFVRRSIEKTKNAYKLLIYFIEGFNIATKCVLIFLSLSCNLVLWYDLKVSSLFKMHTPSV